MASHNRTHASDRGKAIPDIPGTPTIGTATVGGQQATVAFTAGVLGGLPTSYTALSNPGSITGTGSSSPILVSGLSASTSYTFTVKGANSTGESAYSSASNSITTTSPATGMYVWYDAADSSSITASSGFVSQWNDKSGNAFHVTNAGGAAGGCPQTGINTRNSRNVITFTQNATNGAAGGLTNGSTSFLADPTLDVWIVRKHTPGSINSGCALGIGNDQAGSDKVHYQFYDNASNKLKSGANGGFVLSTATQNGTWNITRFTKSGASQELFLGATSQGTSSYNYNLPSSRLQVGALPQAGATNSGVYLMNGDIAEILVYKSVLTGADYTQTYNYLAGKWNF
jgi:hypothetical protein